MLSSHPTLEYFGDLEANLSYFLSSEWSMGLMLSLDTRRCTSWQHIPFWTIRTAWEAESPNTHGMENSVLLQGHAGTAKRSLYQKGLGVNLDDYQEEMSSLSPSIFILGIYTELHRQQWCSTITTKIIIHNLLQIQQKYLYFFFRSIGFGTRNRITALPLNSTALFIQKTPHGYTTLCNWLWCTAKFTKH